MAVYDFSLRVVSPAFIAGTDKEKPEMRSSTIRGHLRYWWRALYGANPKYARGTDLLYKDESAVFGSTSAGSTFSVVLLPASKIEIGKVAMLPHRENSGGNVSSVMALTAARYQLRLTTRPGKPIAEGAWNALQLWSLLGGVGRRSRRTFGAVDIRKMEGNPQDWYTYPNTPEAWAERIKEIIQKINPPTASSTPAFPTLARNYSRILVGTEGFATQKEANQHIFRALLRNKTYKPKERTFGSVQGGRRASPVHIQVRKINDGFYPVLTAMWSLPDRGMEKKVMSDFMNDAKTELKAIDVWGDLK
jgi:CRISPR type III-B/RAMP module RAMP protein Cmr1